MKNTLKGIYRPENPEKYIGKGNIIYRSSWELVICRKLDKHPSILHWASEPVSIPYYNPVNNKQTIYVPDFLVVYEDKDNIRHNEIWEVKPKCETMESAAKTAKNKLALCVNLAKWEAARKYCDKHGLQFRIINEGDFLNGR